MIETKRIPIKVWEANPTKLRLVQHEDRGRALLFEVIGADGALDLTGKSIIFKAIKPDETAIANMCRIVDAKNGLCEYVVTAQTVVVAGDMVAQLAIEDGSSSIQTRHLDVTVEPSLEITDSIESTDETNLAFELLGNAQGVIDKVHRDLDGAVERVDAEIARIDEAVDSVQTAVQDAEAAATEARDSVASIENLKTEAETAVTNANAAVEQTKAAVTHATAAKEAAENATTNAEEAASKANTAAQNANQAVHDIAGAREQVTTIITDAQEADRLAKDATTTANEAKETAETALSKANQADSAAQNANDAADDARSAAQEARDAALNVKEGKDGLSAYELAVEAGFEGDETSWLASLNGETGDKGASAFEIAQAQGFKGSEAEWLESLHAKAPKNVSELTNDAGYITADAVPDPLPSGGMAGQVIKKTSDGVTWAEDKDTTYSEATVDSHGLMSAEDKDKLENGVTITIPYQDYGGGTPSAQDIVQEHRDKIKGKAASFYCRGWNGSTFMALKMALDNNGTGVVESEKYIASSGLLSERKRIFFKNFTEAMSTRLPIGISSSLTLSSTVEAASSAAAKQLNTLIDDHVSSSTPHTYADDGTSTEYQGVRYQLTVVDGKPYLKVVEA